jgi:pyruvate carboxylase
MTIIGFLGSPSDHKENASNFLSAFGIEKTNIPFIAQVNQKSRFVSGQIKCKILDDLPGFSLANFSVPIISV